MSDPIYPLYSIFAFTGTVLCLIPLPWHLGAGNSGTCFFMFWTALACLNQFVNSIVWAGNALNPAPWWCEISIRIIMSSSVAIPASCLCIMRRLYLIASCQSTTTSGPEKRRAILIDTCICLIFPLIITALQYIVQGHRFNIVEDVGCYPALYNTLLTYFLSSMWPPLLGLASFIYCLLTLRKFHMHRIMINSVIRSSAMFSVSRYFRLMALAMANMLCTTPLAVFSLVLNATATAISPWRSWEDTHFNYSRIEQIPAVYWRANHLVSVGVEVTRWFPVVTAIVFFAFFGFAEEARKNYSIALAIILRPFRRETPEGQKNLKLNNLIDSKPSAKSIPLRPFKTSRSKSPLMVGVKQEVVIEESMTTPTSATASWNASTLEAESPKYLPWDNRPNDIDWRHTLS